jgi:methylmalonyl-CoA/ethylmalonyl-CoA epimerase
MEKLEHIGIAVKNIDRSNPLFASLLGTEHYKIEDVESEGVRTSFFHIGGVKIELLEATHQDSPIAKFIEKKGEGVHHLAFSVSDLKQSVQSYVNKGFEIINEEPKKGADNKMICFLHPKSTGGVLIELCEEAVSTQGSADS